MMPRRLDFRRLLLLAAATACLVVLIGCLIRAYNALAEYERAERDYNTTSEQLEELRRLRLTQQSVMVHAEPAQDLIARVNDILKRTHLNSTCFRGQTPQSDQPAEEYGPAARRQCVRLSFRGWTTPQLGAFLKIWTSEQSLWRPTQLELTHCRNSTAPATYDVAMTIEGIYTEIDSPKE